MSTTYLDAVRVKISLHKLVSELTQSLLPAMVKRRSLVLNEIPRDLFIVADENMMAYVLWSLLNGVLQSTQNECIHIEALTVSDHLLIRIKDAGTYFHHAISRQYRQVQQVAEKLGGSIGIESGEDYTTNAAFRISSSLLAA